MDERKVADYFVVAGLPPEKEAVDEFSKDGFHIKSTQSRAPITDIAVVFPTLGEATPEGYTLIEKTPTGLPADLNYGSIRSPEVYLCYRRGRDKPPLVDIGVMYEGKERVLEDSEVVAFTPSGKPANVNNSNAKTLLTYRRAPATMPCNSLVVTDIVVIITSKGETPPHAFCMIKKNLNKGLVGCSIYLCYKKSMNRANLISYKPGILVRYPYHDYPKLPLPSSVPMFCMPMGCTLERWPLSAQQPAPIFSTFVLTVSDAAEKLYGSAVTFYEPFPEVNLSEEQRKGLKPTKEELSQDWTYNINKCICLLSRWPFFDTCEKFLMFLYDMSINGERHTIPIERYITYLLEDVPFPSVQRPRILIQLSPNDRLILTQPEELPLPRGGASFRQLLMNLGPDNCLILLFCVLTEQKILVHSLRPDVLTAVAEAISMMVFPFKWQCPYIPLCPLSLAEVLNAPLPFLIGVDSRFFDLYEPPPDVSCVDLDTNSVTACDEKKNVIVKILPKKAARILRITLEHLFKKTEDLIKQTMEHNATMNQTSSENSIDKDFQLKHKEQSLELEIQEAFLRFMATVLKGYRTFLLPITKAPTVGTTDTNSLFDLNGFLKTLDKAYYKFFHMVTKTQMFIRFIEERSFVSDMDASLAFFDECTEKADTEDEIVHLIDVDESHRSERTMFVMPPEPPLSNMVTYVYEGFQVKKDLLGGRAVGPGVERVGSSGALPGSPMARRTKHEIKAAQRLARKSFLHPHMRAKCLFATCCTIWFIHLPSYVLTQNNAPATLRYAYDLLCRVHKAKLIHIDEVCYRVMMQLCGLYSQPVVAVKLLFLMKRAGIQPNAITYGFYNRAVLEATWPSGMNNSSQLLWNKLRNVILGAAHFRKAGVTAGKRKVSLSGNEEQLLECIPAPDTSSHTSAESSDKFQGFDVKKEGDEEDGATTEEENSENRNAASTTVGFAAFDKFRSRVGSIIRPSGLPLLTPSTAFNQQQFASSAGLLMTGGVAEEDEDSGLSSSSGGGEETVLPSRTSKRRRRRGSCSSDFTYTPTTPTSDHCFKLLTRSESFASDAGILAKLNSLKLEGKATVEEKSKGSKRMPGFRCPGQPQGVGGYETSLHRIEDDAGTASVESSSENIPTSVAMGTPTRLGDRNEWSPVWSPSRTPVTENDPLGALDIGAEAAVREVAGTTEAVRVPGPVPTLDHSGAPVLFERRAPLWPPRSHSLVGGSDDEEDLRPTTMHRSATMPDSPHAGLASLPASFKLSSFTRYASTRFSFRKAAEKAAEIKFNTQLIENALNNFSPSSLSGKKSEILMGGLSTLKSAATSVYKKFDELKEAISANSTPIKAGANSSVKNSLDRDANFSFDDEDMYEDIFGSRRKISSDFCSLSVNQAELAGSTSFDNGLDSSRKGSTSNLSASMGGEPGGWSSQLCILFPKSQRDSSIPVAMQVVLTTCSRCHNCGSILYDEEIMAGWLAEDSNLNTKCQFCDKATVPLLYVTVIDYRCSPMPVSSQESIRERKHSNLSLGASRTSISDLGSDLKPVNGEVVLRDCKVHEPITVPYLNPLVLRKEFESILSTEGDSCLTQSKFVDEHPIIYWNMVWVLTRVGLESHLCGLALGASCGLSDCHPSWNGADTSNVLVSTLWHNNQLNEEAGVPMFMLWNQGDTERSALVDALVTETNLVPRSLMEKVISCLQCCDLDKPIEMVAKERCKWKGRGHSLYRDILFLAITAIGRENIDQAVFDREYMGAFNRSQQDQNSKLYIRSDQPLSIVSSFCKRYFRPLELFYYQ